MRNHRFRLALSGISLLLSGCGELLGTQCSDEGRFAVNVEVRDARTGSALTEGVVVIIQEGPYADTARSPDLAAGFERPGTYDVRVQKTGYQEWTQRGVQVTRSGGCDRLRSAKVTAQLQPVGLPQ